MEIFGIPVFFIFLFVIAILQDYAQKQEKQKEEATQKLRAIIEEITQRWDAITVGMSVGDVLELLGKPSRIVKMGTQEAWGYGPNSSDGEILFIDGRVVGFQKPSCTLNVCSGQSAEASTSDISG